MHFRSAMELQDDALLVARLLDGDHHAMEQLAFGYRRFITAVLIRHARLYPDDLEDLYQRFLFHIWEDGCRRLRPWRGTRSLRSYLGAVARNLARDYRRERLRQFDGDSARVIQEPFDEPAGGSVISTTVNAGLAQLAARDQDLIHRRYYHDESYREIAQALGITVNHVGVALSRAESRLRVILQQEYDGNSA